MLIKCFSAQTYFVNSKIIQDVVENNGNPYAKNKDSEASSGTKLFQVSDVLMELEFVKRELYNQINLSEKLVIEKERFQKQVVDIEEEMQMTIESYKSVLTASETDIETDHGKAKVELIQMTKQLDQLDMERQKLLAEKVVLKDEKKGLSLMLERSQHM